MAHSCDAIVIGAGLSGLTVAERLRAAGRSVRVLEKSGRPGGVISSQRSEGFLVEAGPNSMMVKAPEVARYLETIGLAEQQVPANPVAKKRFLVRGGRVLPLPSSPLEAITTPLYTGAAKLRLLGEPWRRATGDEDTSVAEFVQRRLGVEFLHYGIAPLVSGIFAGDPQKLSVRHAFPKVWGLEARSQSLIRGTLALRREQKANGTPPFRSQLISFRDGLEALPRQQARRLANALTCEVELTALSPADGGWNVSWTHADGSPASASARQLIVTTPTHTWERLPWRGECAGLAAEFPVVEHPPVATLVLGFRREQVKHPLDGFGMLIPTAEDHPILGSIFSSTLFPGRAPEGQVALMCFMGGATRPAAGRLSADEAIATALPVLRRLLGISGEPTFSSHTAWLRAIPQYNVGYQRFLDQLSTTEHSFPGLHWHGSFRGGPGLGDIIANSLRLAARLAPES